MWIICTPTSLTGGSSERVVAWHGAFWIEDLKEDKAA